MRAGDWMGYAVDEVGCTVCGAGCDPVSIRCPHCGSDPLRGMGVLIGPLAPHQLMRAIGFRLLVVLVLGGYVLVREAQHFAGQEALWNALGWIALIVLVLALWSFGRNLWQLWLLTRLRLVLTDSGILLFYRRGGRVYLDRMDWGELEPPVPSRSHWLLSLLRAIGHLLAIGGLHWLALILPGPAREVCLRSLFNPARRWIIPVSTLIITPTELLTWLAVYAAPRWLSNGQIAIEPGYEPTPERPFLALDIDRRLLRAYAFRDVLLDEVPMDADSVLNGMLPPHWLRPESTNPDGTRVEADFTLEPAPPLRRNGSLRLPVFALPYGKGYWLRADWNLIARIEARRRASEIASSRTATT